MVFTPRSFNRPSALEFHILEARGSCRFNTAFSFWRCRKTERAASQPLHLSVSA